MGTSFTTAHIHNAQSLTKAQFKKAFTDMMKAKGYTASDEENAALTYTLAFSPDRKWVTVLTDSADTRREAAELAKALKMHTVMIELVDSDFAELSLFDETGAHKDTLTLGNSYLEDAAPIGNPAAWQPLLRGSWEQVQEIQNGSYTFAEDALAQFAPLIGMDSGNVLLDNDSADDNAVVLHFKKAAEKKLTLNSAFVKVFGEALEPLGFVRAGRKPVYVRLLDTGVLHIIACQKEKDADTFYRDPFRDKNAFCIYGTVSTIYDNDMMIDNKVYATPSSIDNASVYTGLNPFNWDRKVRTSLMYSFYDDTDSSLMAKMKSVLEETQKYILKALETANTIEECIIFCDKFGLAKKPDHWFLLSKDYNASLDLYFESAKTIVSEEYLNGKDGRKPEDLPKYLKGFKDVVERKRCKFNNLVSDKEAFMAFIEERERIRIKNVQLLNGLRK